MRWLAHREETSLKIQNRRSAVVQRENAPRSRFGFAESDCKRARIEINLSPLEESKFRVTHTGVDGNQDSGYSDQQRLLRQASKSAASASRLMARPMYRARSIHTSGWIAAQSRFLRRTARNVSTSRFTVFEAAPCARREV